jgi:hypothetical protein
VLVKKSFPAAVEDGIDCFDRIAAAVEHLSHFLQVGNGFDTFGNLEISKTAIKVRPKGYAMLSNSECWAL